MTPERDDGRAALVEAIESLDDVADTHRIWRTLSAERLADAILARLVGYRLTPEAPDAGADAAWQALEDEVTKPMRVVAAALTAVVIDRHRPVIEAAIRADTAP